MPAAAPLVSAAVPAEAEVGTELKFSAEARADGVPAISYHWDFGDGTEADRAAVTHAYTRADNYTVRLKVEGVDGMAAESGHSIIVKGLLSGHFDLPGNRRYIQENQIKPDSSVQ